MSGQLRIVMTGAPGCGKGTQSRILSEKAGIPHLSTGEMLRAEVDKATPLGLKLKEILDKGNLAPADLIIDIISKRIDEPDCEKGFIFDGFPRTIGQTEAMQDMLKDKGIALSAAVEILVPDEIIMERILGRYTCMKCGQGYHDKFLKPKVYGVCDKCGGTNFYRRIDDNKATVENRLVNYREQTLPTIPFFEGEGLLKKVDGTGSIEAVAREIAKVLEI